MSYYDARDSRGYRVKRDRYSRPGGGYVEETYVDNRGGYGYDYDSRLVRRHDSEESVVEEVARDFPPGEYYYGNPGPRRAATVREGVRRARSVGRDPYYDEEYYRREDYRPRRSKRSDGRRKSMITIYPDAHFLAETDHVLCQVTAMNDVPHTRHLAVLRLVPVDASLWEKRR